MRSPAWLPPLNAVDRHRIEARRAVTDLLRQLHGAFEIAQRARLVRAALRNDIGPPAAAAHVLRYRFERDRVARELFVGEIADLGAQHAIQQEIAVVGGRPHTLHRDDGLETETGGHRRDGAAAIRLERADGDERVGVLVESVRHQELEFADLVAGLEQAREVVTLHVELDAQPPRDTLELHDGRGRQGQLDARRRLCHAPYPSTPFYECCFFKSAAMGAKS